MFFTLTGAGPLLSPVRVTLHPFTYSVKPKAKSCLLMSRRLKVNNQPCLAPPAFLPVTRALCRVNGATYVVRFCSTLHICSLSWRWGSAPDLRPAAERDLRSGWEETPLQSDGEPLAVTQSGKRWSAGSAESAWQTESYPVYIIDGAAQASGYISGCSGRADAAICRPRCCFIRVSDVDCWCVFVV